MQTDEEMGNPSAGLSATPRRQATSESVMVSAFRERLRPLLPREARSTYT